MRFIETAPVGVGFDCRTVDSIVDASHVVAAYDIVASTWTVAGGLITVVEEHEPVPFVRRYDKLA